MALGSFVAGRYTGTYNSVGVGMCKEGYELEQDMELDEINETDAWGGTVVDGIWRGGNCHLQFTSEEFLTGVLAAFWPFGALGILTTATPAPPIGALASSLAKAMLLTVVTGTPAQTVVAPGIVINTLTASGAFLAKNFNGKLLFNSKLREVPIRLRLYPYVSTNTVFFTTT